MDVALTTLMVVDSFGAVVVLAEITPPAVGVVTITLVPLVFLVKTESTVVLVIEYFFPVVIEVSAVVLIFAAVVIWEVTKVEVDLVAYVIDGATVVKPDEVEDEV